jgi:hypothetical protein
MSLIIDRGLTSQSAEPEDHGLSYSFDRDDTFRFLIGVLDIFL